MALCDNLSFGEEGFVDVFEVGLIGRGKVVYGCVHLGEVDWPLGFLGAHPEP